MNSPQEISLYIYNLLKERPLSVSELHEKLSLYGVSLSKRSIYRYLSRIENSIANSTDVFEIETLDNNRRSFSIRQGHVDVNISDEDWIYFINSLVLFQEDGSLSKVARELTDNMFAYVLKNAPLKTQLLSIISNPKELYQTSSFGQIIFNERLKSNLFKFIYYFSKKEKLSIQKYSKIVVLNSLIPKVGEALIPLKILYHRGNYAFCFYSALSNRIFSLEIDMIEKLAFTKLKYTDAELARAQALIQIESFGYHQALVKGVYTISLIFPPNPGGHVVNRIWHSTQKFFELSGGYIRMEFRSEINIELLGWISMWLDNVKVIEPPILKELLEQKYSVMQKLLRDDSSPNNNG